MDYNSSEWKPISFVLVEYPKGKCIQNCDSIEHPGHYVRIIYTYTYRGTIVNDFVLWKFVFLYFLQEIYSENYWHG